MTSGMSAPVGTFSSAKVPSVAVVVETTGLPDGGAAQLVHATPAANGSTVVFGT
jgi:hypothetical protein